MYILKHDDIKGVCLNNADCKHPSWKSFSISSTVLYINHVDCKYFNPTHEERVCELLFEL